ncbi:uncharacterized protein LOC132558487 [Ylistrum balloti]|uniref:uncharacterized protein LOC132558487 n=1 Tax=Ylistrum balloti TaxID=509963 RepID=UPI002905A83E|nr:uncharacterized protein LOC132558487 [Ylistrum balloti]
MTIRLTYIDNDINNIQASSFKARILSNNVSVWARELAIPKPTIEYHPDFKVLKAIVKVFDVDPESLWYHYSLNGSYYHRKALLWKKNTNVYVLEHPTIIAYFYFSTTPCTVICKVTTVWEPLKRYITVMIDDNNRLYRQIPYALDQDLNTCFDLPTPGNSPSMLWLMIKDLSLFNVMSQKFVVHVTGENIECSRVGQKILLVGTSGPSNSDKCILESDIAICRMFSQRSNSTAPQCDFECVCEDLQKCSNVHVLMQSANKDVWRLCELNITDVL